MIRTGHYWLSILPEDVKANFIKNLNKDYYLDKESDFGDFMNCSFSWSKTKEGALYWLVIANKDPMEFIKMKRDEKIKDILEND